MIEGKYAIMARNFRPRRSRLSIPLRLTLAVLASLMLSSSLSPAADDAGDKKAEVITTKTPTLFDKEVVKQICDPKMTDEILTVHCCSNDLNHCCDCPSRCNKHEKSCDCSQ